MKREVEPYCSGGDSGRQCGRGQERCEAQQGQREEQAFKAEIGSLCKDSSFGIHHF